MCRVWARLAFHLGVDIVSRNNGVCNSISASKAAGTRAGLGWEKELGVCSLLQRAGVCGRIEIR